MSCDSQLLQLGACFDHGGKGIIVDAQHGLELQYQQIWAALGESDDGGLRQVHPITGVGAAQFEAEERLSELTRNGIQVVISDPKI